MNKNLLIISLVLISLLAIGAVSAADAYNTTDDSALSMIDDDMDVGPVADEMDNLEAAPQVEELEKVDEEQNLLNEINNQSTEVLSDGDSNSNKPMVVVGDISFKSGNVSIPFHVADSQGNPVSGQAIVTILSEKATFSKTVNLIDGSGQLDFKITDVLGTMGVDEKDIPELYDIISSSITDMKINVSDIISGFEDIYNSFSINMSNVIAGWDRIAETNYINCSEFNRGMNSIENSLSINRTGIEEGIKDIINGLNFNISKIIQLVLFNITESNINFTKIGSDLKVFIDDFTLKISNFLDNISQVFSFNKTAFNDTLNDFFNEFNVTRQVALDKIEDLMTNLNFTGELKDNVIDILNGNNFTFSNIFNVIKDVIATNLTISNVTDLLSDIINGSNISIALKNILSSVNFDYDKIADVFNNIFNTSAIIDKFLNITGINITKISNVFEGIGDIYKGISFNISNLTSGFKEIFAAISLNSSAVKEILMGIHYNNINLSKIIDVFNNIRVDYSKVLMGLYDLINLNMTAVSNGWADILNSTNFNASAIKDGFDKISGVFNFNASNIISVLKDNVEEYLSINVSAIVTGAKKIVDAFYLNVSSIKEGISQIADAFKFNLTGILGGLKDIINSFGFNASKFNEGIGKIIQLPSINISSILTKLIVLLSKNAVLSFFLIPDSAIYSLGFKLPTSIDCSQVSTTYGKSKNMVITLKGILGDPISGKKVSVKLNGKTYSGKTNAKGQVSIKVPKNLVPKTYNAVITFNGDDNHMKSSKTVKVVVSKLTPKLTAKQKTFKRSVKTKKYTVTLKTNKNKAMKKKKVTLKVNGKTYKAKTNKKGKATFKITKLTKKGTFKAVIKFKGNKYYKKVTKKAKIKIM